MARLKDVHEALHRVFRGHDSVGAGAEALGCDPARLAIYAEFVRAHMREALDKNYVFVRAMLPPALWDQLCEGYFAARPSSTWEVNGAAEGFAGYLEEQRVAGAELHPAHVVMAELEWEQFVAYMHPADIPAPADVEVITLNPTVTALELPYDLLELIARAGDELGPDTPLPEPDPTIALIYRDPADCMSRAERATPALLFGFKVAAEGLDLAAAAAAAGVELDRARAIIADCAERGLIIAPTAA